MKLLVLRLSALGDVIHTIPAVVALREAGAEISWVVEAPYADLVETVARVRAVPVRLKHWARHPLDFRSDIARALRAIRGCEGAVDFQGLIKSAAITWMSRAPQRFGFAADAIRERAALAFINRKVSIDKAQHVIDWNLQLARAVGDLREPKVDWSKFPDDPMSKLQHLAKRVVLLPGAGRPNKQWPAERFREIAKRYNAVTAWGPGERHLADAIGGDIAPETNLRELAWLLQHARVVVGADTGPLHLAAALGTPVVGLYGPTDPRRNGPYGQLASTVDHFRTTRTMESITTDDVVQKLDEVGVK